MKLKEKVKYHRNMQDHFRDESNMYKDLLEISLHQAKLSNLQKEHLLSIIDEVEVLLEKYSDMAKDNRERSNYEMLLAIIENWKNRHNLDTILSNREVAEWQYNFSDIEEKVDKITEEIIDEFEEDEEEVKLKSNIDILNNELEEYWNTLVLSHFELVKFVWLSEDDDDYYYRFINQVGEEIKVSACIWFIPLYGFLSDDDYNRLDTRRDLNVENNYEK